MKIKSLSILLLCLFYLPIRANIENDTLLAATYREEGRSLSKNKQYDAALICFEEALELYRQYPQLYLQVARLYDRIGILQRKLNRLTSALSYFKKATEMLQQHHNQGVLYGEITQRIGNMYIEMGDFNTAQDYLLLSLKVFQENNATAKIPEPYINLANLHTQQNNLKKAEQYYQKALQYSLDTVLKIALYNNIVDLYVAQNNYSAAITSAQKALQYQQQLHPNPDENTIIIWHTLAEIHQAMGQIPLTSQYLHKAQETAQQIYGNKTIMFKKTNEWLANYHTTQGQIDTALRYVQQALIAIIPNFNDPNIATLPNIEQLYAEPEIMDLLHQKADLHAQLYQITCKKEDLQYALNSYQLAIKHLNSLVQGYLEDESKTDMVSSQYPLFEKAIATALQLQQTELAFHLVQHSKAVILLDALQHQQNLHLAHIPDSIQQNERKWRLRIANYEQQHYECLNNPQIPPNHAALYQDSLFRAKRQLEQLINNIEKNYTNYYQLKYAHWQTIPLSTTQKQLAPDQLLVEYFLGDSTLYAFAVTQNHFYTYELPITPKLYRTFTTYRKATSDWDFVRDSSSFAKQQYLQTAHLLYQQLIQPILANMGSTSSVQRLTIVPDGWIGYISFSALITAPFDKWNTLDVPYLLRQYAISYAYSSALSGAQNQALYASTNHLHNFGGMGLVYDDFTLTHLHKETATNDNKDSIALNNKKTLCNNAKNKKIWQKLPNAPIEVNNIQQLIGGKTWTNLAATKLNMLSNMNDCKVWHLAAHGFIDEDNPLQSAIVLTKTIDTIDNFLRAADIYGLSSNSNLVVLSACNSGMGQIKRGEGVMSLARAFAYSGCPSLLMSLWSVPDQTTSDMMRLFYEQLKAGDEKDIALQKAQLNYLATTKSSEHYKPLYWAAPVLIGDVSAVHFDKQWNWYIVIGVIIAAILGLLYYIKLSK
jgi:CHAT domain-containing protein